MDKKYFFNLIPHLFSTSIFGKENSNFSIDPARAKFHHRNFFMFSNSFIIILKILLQFKNDSIQILIVFGCDVMMHPRLHNHFNVSINLFVKWSRTNAFVADKNTKLINIYRISVRLCTKKKPTEKKTKRPTLTFKIYRKHTHLPDQKNVCNFLCGCVVAYIEILSVFVLIIIKKKLASFDHANRKKITYKIAVGFWLTQSARHTNHKLWSNGNERKARIPNRTRSGKWLQQITNQKQWFWSTSNFQIEWTYLLPQWITD